MLSRNRRSSPPLTWSAVVIGDPTRLSSRVRLSVPSGRYDSLQQSHPRYESTITLAAGHPLPMASDGYRDRLLSHAGTTDSSGLRPASSGGMRPQ